MLSMVAHAYDPKSRRLRQEEIESEARLGYTAISRPAGRHSENSVLYEQKPPLQESISRKQACFLSPILLMFLPHTHSWDYEAY